jgi:hypothetical protein
MQVTDGLERRRLTVFFRLILVIPHLIWLGIWGIGAFFLAIANWVVTLVRGETSPGLHRFFTSFITYATHVYAYLYIAANSYPGFLGDKQYEVNLEFDPPQRQNRWTVAFRLILAIPVFALLAVITGGSGGSSYYRSGGGDQTTSYGLQALGVAAAGGIIAWFYSLARGRAPEGIRRMTLFALHFGAQAASYIFLITDRYPSPDPTVLGIPRPPIPHPVTLTVPHDELERSRLTVFFRLLLAIPHFVWLALWGVVALVVAILNWFATLFGGQSPAAFHRFLSAYVRYQVHVYAFVTLTANPFPGFTGTPGTYPVEAQIADRQPQRRVVTGFRIFMVIPAAIVSSALGSALYVCAFLGWWAALFTARMPRGLRNLQAYSLRYSAQLNSYVLLLTDHYPYAGPPASADSVLPETTG